MKRDDRFARRVFTAAWIVMLGRSDSSILLFAAIDTCLGAMFAVAAVRTGAATA